MNLLATLLLVTRERARDFAIFKAIGLTPRGVLGVVNSGGAALGADRDRDRHPARPDHLPRA